MEKYLAAGRRAAKLISENKTMVRQYLMLYEKRLLPTWRMRCVHLMGVQHLTKLLIYLLD